MLRLSRIGNMLVNCENLKKDLINSLSDRARELTLKFDVGEGIVMKMEKYLIVHVLKWSPVCF